MAAAHGAGRPREEGLELHLLRSGQGQQLPPQRGRARAQRRAMRDERAATGRLPLWRLLQRGDQRAQAVQPPHQQRAQPRLHGCAAASQTLHSPRWIASSGIVAVGRPHARLGKPSADSRLDSGRFSSGRRRPSPRNVFCFGLAKVQVLWRKRPNARLLAAATQRVGMPQPVQGLVLVIWCCHQRLKA